MGCDIHLHTEIKVNGKWEHYGVPEIRRNYSLFAKMAGVRWDDSNIAPVSDPKGFPQDASVVTKLDYEQWGPDAHTPSWLDAKEISELEDWLSKEMGENSWKLEWEYWGYLFGNGWGEFTKYPDERPPFLEDIRFVFWFDN